MFEKSARIETQNLKIAELLERNQRQGNGLGPGDFGLLLPRDCHLNCVTATVCVCVWGGVTFGYYYHVWRGWGHIWVLLPCVEGVGSHLGTATMCGGGGVTFGYCYHVCGGGVTFGYCYHVWGGGVTFGYCYHVWGGGVTFGYCYHVWRGWGHIWVLLPCMEGVGSHLGTGVRDNIITLVC